MELPCQTKHSSEEDRAVEADAGPQLVINPEELELAQTTFNEVGAYAAVATMAAAFARSRAVPLRVLDTCSATGLASFHACAGLDVESLTLVDIDPTPLELAGRRHGGRHPEVVIKCGDAVEHRPERQYDMILMNSAYHHIEDERKSRFLQRNREFLLEGGRIIVGDHFLPPYGKGDEELRRALQSFYFPLLKELRGRRTPTEATAVVEKSFQLALRREIEFKVSYERFNEHLKQAGLVVEEVTRVWGPATHSWGTLALRLAPSSEWL